jgi:cell division septum initiation protein DivIVA
MSDPATAREALIAEAIGDVARLLDRVEAVTPALHEACHALEQARLDLDEHLTDFERRLAATTQFAKNEVVRHIGARTDEAARRSIDQQSRAMADAARVAFGAELGATVQRLQALLLQPQVGRRRPRWEPWLTHAAAAAVASAATWGLAVYAGLR